MKIIIYSPLFITGGMENAVFHFVRTIKDYYPKINISVMYGTALPLSSMMHNKLEQVCSVERYVNANRKRAGATYLPVHAEIECDVLINCSNWQFQLSNIKAKKVINWVHGTYIANYDKMGKEPIIVCQSQWQKDKLIESTKCTIPESQFTVIRNIMDARYIKAMALKDIPEKTAWGDAPIKLLMVCRISPEKGFDRAIELMKRPGMEKAVLVIAGVAFNEEGTLIIEKLWKELGHRVRFVGEQENPYPLIKESHYVLALSDFETYGLVSVEAHILGISVVFNDYPTAISQFYKGVDQWYKDFDPTKPLLNPRTMHLEQDYQTEWLMWEKLIHEGDITDER